MLPLVSITSAIAIGALASWNVSTFCSTPSSTTTRSAADSAPAAALSPATLNSIVGRIGGGYGAK